MGNRRRSAFGPKKRREAKEDPPGGAPVTPDDPDRSSGSRTPPGPTAWWAWRCQMCGEHFVARCCAAVDGQKVYWVWDYRYHQAESLPLQPGAENPSCPECGRSGVVAIGVAPLPEDLEKDYQELMAMLKRPPPAPIIRKAEREAKKKGGDGAEHPWPVR